jgi:molybdopterin/thiamine biosynthesis adenylyltransferase
MKRSLKAWRLGVRASYLEHEQELYTSIEHASFRRTKDWDDKGPLVVWEGVLCHPDLSTTYKVEVRYSEEYPFVRPEVYPIEPRISNERHQNPSPRKDKTPGSLCLFPHTPDLWGVGLNCRVIIERTVQWLKAFEAKTLDQEFAPPEIERFFPATQCLARPAVLLIPKFLKVPPAMRDGSCVLMPTISGDFALLALNTGDTDEEALRSEVQQFFSSILPNQKLDHGKEKRGKWFLLGDEPPLPVPLNLAALMRLLTNSGRHLKQIARLASEKAEVVTVFYPAGSSTHWLVFGTNFISPSKRRGGFREANLPYKILNANVRNSVWLYSAHDISEETIFRRVSGFEVGVLSKKKCLILGCGSIGSRIAEVLIKTGVGRMTLVDKDVMRSGNVSRHILGLDSLNRNKAEALREHLLKKNPFVEMEVFTENPVAQPRKFEQLIAATDLVVSCFGNDATELYVNAASAVYGKPVIFCRSHLEGRLGVVLLFSPPKHQACFNCASDYLGQAECPVPKIPPVPYDKLVGLDADCGSAFLPASAVDLDLVSLHGARLSLELLQGRPTENNYWLIRGRDFTSDEYSELKGQIRNPFTMLPYQIPSKNTCEICKLR